MQKHRLVCTLFACLYIMSVMSACRAPAATDTAELPTPKPSLRSDLPEVTITLHYVGNPDFPDFNAVEAALSAKVKEQINANVELVVHGWGDFDTQMNVINASGQAYDLVFTSNWTNNYYQNISYGAFLPLDDLLPAYAPKLYASLTQNYWNATRVNGKLYGIINQQIMARQNGYYFDESLVKKYNIDITKINGPRDLEPFLKAVTNGEPHRIPIPMRYFFEYHAIALGYDDIVSVLTPGVVRYADDTPVVFNQFETAEFRELLTIAHDYYQKGYIEKDAAIQQDISANLNNGKYAMNLEGAMKPGGAQESSAQMHIPNIVEKTIGERVLMTSSVVATMWGLSATSKNPERAIMFMELINHDKELYNLMCFGLEGKHYQKLDDDYIRVFPNSGYTPNTTWMYGSVFNSYLLEGQPADVWAQTKKVNDEAFVSVKTGFAYDPEPAKSIQARVQSVCDDYLLPLTTGASDPEKTLPEFLAKLKAAGVDDLIKEMQRQLDVWYAENGSVQ